ncbi:hypothetical protein DFH08DRAFT_993978 [Mycena albidolilacea]|uniref:Uncharacterized protein n=1 Tax=Mycena albidolilacea TaxID=1033008 RepID=A0AAD7A5S7_9AGAR|nr:hypothetical protein DFH08DRAFT_993978 [Mycena albidolilacea]
MKKQKQEAEKREKMKCKQSDGGEDDVDADEEGVGGVGGKKKRRLVQAMETLFSQLKLKLYKGNNIPFSEDQKSTITHQTLPTTQSANLLERWTTDPEVMKLFMMMCSYAMDAIPSCSQLGSPLLKQTADKIDTQIAGQVNGQDVLMCNQKDVVGGVTLTHKFKSLLVDILRTNQLRKDAARLYLLTFPCCAHQGQLILGDYLKENKEAVALMGELIDFVNWLNNHDKVCTIFDTKQLELFGKILAYLLPNLIHWKTHLVVLYPCRKRTEGRRTEKPEDGKAGESDMAGSDTTKVSGYTN